MPQTIVEGMADAASWSDEVCAELSRVNLHIERRDGAPLVALPSFSPNHRAMGLVVEPVFIGEEAGNWERWYVDLPGTGQSPAGRPRSDDVLDRLVATLGAQFGVRRFAVLGWCYGVPT